MPPSLVWVGVCPPEEALKDRLLGLDDDVVGAEQLLQLLDVKLEELVRLAHQLEPVGSD